MKTYIVTDPCYIIRSNYWDYMGENGEWEDNIVRQLESMTKNKAWCFSTGYGDWSNRMEGDGVHDDHDEFTADTGLVCVCEYTDEVKLNLQHENIPDYCYALLDLEGDVDVSADTSNPNWTVIYVSGENSGAQSLDA